MQVNRYIRDKAMDHVDHALGRPVDPTVESYRNYFATSVDGNIAAEFRASPNWIEGIRQGDMVWFHVSDQGRAALRDHLREIGDEHQLFTVSWGGYDMPQVAASASKARYARWSALCDVIDVPFMTFAATARVRLA